MDFVRFIANNGTALDVTAPTFNSLSGYWEWWCDVEELDDDGIIEVRAIAYPFSGQPVVLQGNYKTTLSYYDNFLPDSDQSLLLWSNKNGTYNGTTVWVDSVSGDDDNAGTEEAPYASIQKAVLDIASSASHSTINLKAGTYLMHATAGDVYIAQAGWLTIQAAPGVSRSSVLLTGREGGSGYYTRVYLCRLRNLKCRKLSTDSKIFEGAGVGKVSSIWLDGVWQVGESAEDLTGSGIASGVIVYYNVGNSVNRALIDDARAPTLGLMSQGVTIDGTSGDCLNTMRTARDVVILNAASVGGDHFDWVQTSGSSEHSMWIDNKGFRFANTNGMLFNDIVKNRLAFVNNALSCPVGVGQGCLSGGNCVIVLHNTFADFPVQIVTDVTEAIPGKGMDHAEGHWFSGNILSYLNFNPATGGTQAEYETLTESASPRQVRQEYNHHVGTGWDEEGTATYGDPGFEDVDEGLFTPLSLSAVLDRTVLWDVDQTERGEITTHGAIVGASEVVDPPTLSLRDGIYDTARLLTITGEGTKYYTVDGSAPTDASTLYTAPFTMATSRTIKVISYIDDVISPTRTGVFQITTGGTPAPPRIATPEILTGAGIFFQWTDTSLLETSFLLRADDGSGMTTVYTYPALAGTGSVGSKSVYGFEFSTAYDTEVIAVNSVGGYEVASGSIVTRPEFGPTVLSEDGAYFNAIDIVYTLPSTLPLTGYRAYIRTTDPLGPWTLSATAPAEDFFLTLPDLAANTEYEIGVTAYNIGPGDFISQTNYNTLTEEFDFDETLLVTTANYDLGWAAQRSIPGEGETVVDTLGILVSSANYGSPTSQVYNGVTFEGMNSISGWDDYDDSGLADEITLYGLRVNLIYAEGDPAAPIPMTDLEIGETYLLQVFMSDDRSGGGFHSRTNTYTIAGHTSAPATYGPAHAVTCIFTASATTENLEVDGSGGAHLSAYQLRKIS